MPEEAEILTLEEVRQIATRPPRPDSVIPRLCATVEHFANKLVEGTENTYFCEQRDRWQDNRTGCEADIRFDERETALKERDSERDRLAALVVLQRQAIDALDLSFDRVQDEEVLRLIESVRSDPDGERAAAEAARDREDARQWREMVADTERMLKEWNDPSTSERLIREADEEAEELRLLREVERTRNDYWSVFEGSTTAIRRQQSAAMDAAWKALADFRARTTAPAPRGSE